MRLNGPQLQPFEDLTVVHAPLNISLVGKD